MRQLILRLFDNLPLRTNIWLITFGITFIMAMLVGAVSWVFFSSQNEKYHKERLVRKERNIMVSLDYFIKERGLSEFTPKIEHKLQELSEIQNIDISAYDTSGLLMGTTLPPSESALAPEQLSNDLLTQLAISQDYTNTTENYEGLAYLSTYFILYGSQYTPIAIINIPYKSEKLKSQQDAQQFLSTLSLTLLFFVVAAGLLSYFFSFYITKSISEVSSNLQKLKFDDDNVKIDYQKNNDFGVLIQAYNQLIDQLEQSKQALAETQRQSAWKEMAKQVAHEINNPLTPMRLSMQHLQRLNQMDPEEAQARISDITESTIQQIDTLSRIASEFSNFAKMPSIKSTEVDLVQSVQQVMGLFRNDPHIAIHFTSDAISTAPIFGDSDYLTRILTNLLKNAKQAIQPDTGNVYLLIGEDETHFTLKVKDDGPGIPESMHSKIFQPNFTTKSSGMGLGLPMVKKAMSEMNGTVELHPLENGTCFRLGFPKITS